ncbi:MULTISPECIES: chromosome segregation protein SMC [unclassified Gemella]|uniref:chromosome segregation protein SMC n=1 Tax=unclassified Gemella TaxID=2624949 RepID=UPI00142F3DAE|nr:chromosome segregation protein SMC [Gemella sp. GL1.1]MBF0746188.1 chromosome segregation protein SMC [Gemella sp. 19428wG2_WT2a]NYS27453.1 chromosome segregation protein SMC [Gemella sp. GL1]
MKLKQIEINGFKSFQSKSIISIDSNLIGIVGPNGSGKSNIIDAIRWVLGEQSAKNLRGNSMNDIIFSGSEDKKSKNFAEVSISFDLNEEEHVITRRLYKNGDSEYLLDGKRSKLKDITDIYLDLGVNKESYSIITQGKVDTILSSKAQDRRIIIEEVAGILKYKKKKRKSILKLERTQSNLNRLRDIFIEIEARHKILFEQKKLTEQYLKYVEDLKEKDISLQVFNIKMFQNKMEETQLQLDDLLNKKSDLEKQLLNLDNNINNNKEELHNNDNTYIEYKDRELILVEEIGKLESTIKLYEEKKNSSSTIQKKLDEEISILKQKKDEKTELDKIYKIELKNIKRDLAKISEKIKNEKSQTSITIEEIDEVLDEFKNKYFNLVNQESRLENDIVLNEQMLITKKHSIEEVNQEINNLEYLLEDQRNEIDNLVSLRNKYEKEKFELKEDRTLNLDKQIKLDEDRMDLINNISKGNDLFNALNTKKVFLENQYASETYYNVGVKEILAQKEKIKGIYDVLANVITVKKEYVNALDVALVSNQQNIIVDNSNTARLCVKHLKKINKGRATFLPLENIKFRKIDNNIYELLKKQVGFIDIADKLVDFDKKFEGAVSNVLGLIIVCDNLFNANKIAEIIEYRYRIITLDGQVINSGGSISGGAMYKTSNSIIKYKSELDNLSFKVVKLESKLNKLKTELKSLDEEYITIKNYLVQLKDSENQIDKNLTDNFIRLESLQEKILSLETALANEKSKLNSFGDMNKLNASRTKSKEKLINIRKELNLINLRIDEEQKRKNTVSLEQNEQNEFINELFMEKSRLGELIKFKEDLLAKNRETIEEIENRMSRLVFENNKNLENLNKVFELPRYKNKLKKFIKELSTVKEKIDDVARQKHILYSNDIRYSEQQKEYYDKLTKLNNEVEKINISRSQFSVKIEEMIIYLNTTYSISYEAAEKMFNDIAIIDISNYKGAVMELKSKINSLGNINLNALEEYTAINERYEFYKLEIDDLLGAKSKLEITIAEIDDEVKERFLTTFNIVSEHFSRIYRVLFRGGNAQMTLDNPDNLLETGINILVSPPGKKLQMLSLLSGGEKALTALSLLFAILEIKQPPFVILDEVEAALDDINVLRFAKFLKTYSKENQFLVITHRRITMEEMDKLYGVTMKEKGVSYILSLDLNTILKEDFINE